MKNNSSAENMENKNMNSAKMLLKIAYDNCKLFIGSDGKCYAKIIVEDCIQYRDIESGFFRSWLTSVSYREGKNIISGHVIDSVVTTLKSLILFDPEYNNKQDVYLRVGGNYEKVYLDLGNSDWTAVEIDKFDWKVISNDKTPFRRTKFTGELPNPVRGGNIDLLRKYLTCTDEDFILVVAWLVGCYNPLGPYPILILQGTQGSGKSTQSQLLKRLVDPSVGNIRTLPKDEFNIMLQANSNWLLTYDNLSGLDHRISDTLCRLSTGGSISTRQLYSNDEEVMFSAKRPILLNGIDDITTRGDLADRSILILLNSIRADRRITEKEYWEEFNRDYPYILGAILDLVTSSLRNFDGIELENPPRMADFAKWASACEVKAGFTKGSLITALHRNKSEMINITLENDMFISGLIKFMEDKSEWVGGLQDLLRLVRVCVEIHDSRSHNFPNHNKVKDRLSRFSTQLQSKGIYFEHKRTSTGVEVRLFNTGNM